MIRPNYRAIVRNGRTFAWVKSTTLTNHKAGSMLTGLKKCLDDIYEPDRVQWPRDMSDVISTYKRASGLRDVAEAPWAQPVDLPRTYDVGTLTTRDKQYHYVKVMWIHPFDPGSSHAHSPDVRMLRHLLGATLFVHKLGRNGRAEVEQFAPPLGPIEDVRDALQLHSIRVALAQSNTPHRVLTPFLAAVTDRMRCELEHGRRPRADLPRPWMGLDLETTGLVQGRDVAIQVGSLVVPRPLSYEEILGLSDGRDDLLRVAERITEGAADTHGIDREALDATGVDPTTYLRGMCDRLRRVGVLVTYNGSFDLVMLMYTMLRYYPEGLQALEHLWLVDVMQSTGTPVPADAFPVFLARTRRAAKLKAAFSAEFRDDFPGEAHDALADVRATLALESRVEGDLAAVRLGPYVRAVRRHAPSLGLDPDVEPPVAKRARHSRRA